MKAVQSSLSFADEVIIESTAVASRVEGEHPVYEVAFSTRTPFVIPFQLTVMFVNGTAEGACMRACVCVPLATTLYIPYWYPSSAHCNLIVLVYATSLESFILCLISTDYMSLCTIQYVNAILQWQWSTFSETVTVSLKKIFILIVMIQLLTAYLITWVHNIYSMYVFECTTFSNM